MPKWFWYVARPDELLIDCDSKTLLDLFFRRLERVNPDLPYDLDVKQIFVAESAKENHFHIAVQLEKGIPAIHRAIWQLYLMDDVYRTVNNLWRSILHTDDSPILIISPKNWLCSGVAVNSGKFWRNPDAVCICEREIHKNPKTIWNCPAHLRLRGPRQ